MRKNIIGIYTDEDLVAPAIEKLDEAGVKVTDVYTPFPVFDIMHAMKLKSRFPYFAFGFGVMGFLLTFWFLYWSFVQSYPLNFGGKPSFSLSFVVILFVMVINITVVTSLIAFFVREKKGPGTKAKEIVDGVNDDKFVLLIEDVKSDDEKAAKASEILKASGAADVIEKEVED